MGTIKNTAPRKRGMSAEEDHSPRRAQNQQDLLAEHHLLVHQQVYAPTVVAQELVADASRHGAVVDPVSIYDAAKPMPGDE